jgi:serine/threonine-protein kinase
MTLLQNRYLLGEELGQGSFGKTYLATDTHLNRKCVVKELIWSGDPKMVNEVRNRFAQEALMLQGLGYGSQGGIPELYAYFSENERHYLVQEWIDGETLTQKLKREGPQTEAATVHLLLGALRVLDYIHTRPIPIIHRDIKPDNIMLRRTTGQVVLIDFGVVKVVTPLKAQTILAGTTDYMPKEQEERHPIFASDLYALGMTAIHYATNQSPSSLVDPTSLVDPSSRKLNWRGKAPQISKELADLLDRAIRYDPQERFSSAREFALAIVQIPTLPVPAEEKAYWLAQIPPAQDVEVKTLFLFSSPGKSFAPPPSPAVQPSPVSVPSVTSDPSLAPTSRNAAAQPHVKAAPAIQMLSQPPTRRLLPLFSLTLALALFLAAGLLMWWIFIPTTSQSTSKPTQQPLSQETQVLSVIPPEGMVFIPGGVFRMGSPSAEDPAKPYEVPAHEVIVSPFFIDKYEVTNAAYAAFVKATGHPAPPDWKNGTYPVGKANYPVGNVSWEDARAYAAWAGKRLPTEAEWEFAARGTEGRRYPWGNEFNRWLLNSAETNVGHTEPVGSFPAGATPEGVFDLAGNVAEWTASDDAPYPGSARKPVPGTKIVRGGGFSLPGKYAAATKRTQVPPDTRDPALGFRCARDVELPPSKNQ